MSSNSFETGFRFNVTTTVIGFAKNIIGISSPLRKRTDRIFIIFINFKYLFKLSKSIFFSTLSGMHEKPYFPPFFSQSLFLADYDTNAGAGDVVDHRHIEDNVPDAWRNLGGQFFAESGRLMKIKHFRNLWSIAGSFSFIVWYVR